MTIKRKKASAYDTVNTAAICRYIKEYSGKAEPKRKSCIKSRSRKCLRRIDHDLLHLRHSLH